MFQFEPVTILLAEDDSVHARIVEKGLQQANLSNPLILLQDGQSVLDYLFSMGSFKGLKPAGSLLMLIDLSLSLIDAYEVLRILKTDQRTQAIPLVVMLNNDDPSEQQKCHELGCNVCVTKPVNYEKFSDILRKFNLFLTIVAIPGSQRTNR